MSMGAEREAVLWEEVRSLALGLVDTACSEGCCGAGKECPSCWPWLTQDLSEETKARLYAEFPVRERVVKCPHCGGRVQGMVMRECFDCWHNNTRKRELEGAKP